MVNDSLSTRYLRKSSNCLLNQDKLFRRAYCMGHYNHPVQHVLKRRNVPTLCTAQRSWIGYSHLIYDRVYDLFIPVGINWGLYIDPFNLSVKAIRIKVSPG
jgi:hypothetical protein